MNTTLPLSADEAEFLRAGGTDLKEFLPAGDGVRWGNRLYFRRHFKAKDIFDPTHETNFIKKRVIGTLKRGQGLYGLETDCGYLMQTDEGPAICGVHESPERPDICGSFTEGSWSCRQIRERRGVGMDTEEINLNLVKSALGESALQTVQANV